VIAAERLNAPDNHANRHARILRLPARAARATARAAIYDPGKILSFFLGRIDFIGR